MHSDAFFPALARALISHTTYAKERGGLTISVPDFLAFAQQYSNYFSAELPSSKAILGEGVRRGYWDIDDTSDAQTAWVIVRWAALSTSVVHP